MEALLAAILQVLEPVLTLLFWRRYRDAQERPGPLSVLGDIDPRRPAAADPPLHPR